MKLSWPVLICIIISSLVVSAVVGGWRVRIQREGYAANDDAVDKIAKQAVEQLSTLKTLSTPQGSIERVEIVDNKLINPKSKKEITTKEVTRSWFLGNYVATIKARPKFYMPTLKAQDSLGKDLAVRDDVVLTKRFIIKGQGKSKNAAVDNANKKLDAIRDAIVSRARTLNLMKS